MTVSTVTILAPPDGFDTYDLRPGIDMAWTGGVGPFDVRYEWDDNTGFTSPITVLNTSVTSPDSAVPTSDMGPHDTDWFFRVTVIDNDDAGEVQEPVGSHRILHFQDADDGSRYLYLHHNIGVGFGLDPFDGLPLGDGLAPDFPRHLYLNHNIDSTQPCPWLDSIAPTLQTQGGTVTLFGDAFGALQSTYATEIRLYETQDLTGGSYTTMSAVSWFDTEVSVTVPSGASTGWVAVVHTSGATCDGSAFKLLNVELVTADPDMGWWIQTVDKENNVTASASILPHNITRASFKKIMNAIGSGVIEMPLSDPDIESIIDPLMRKGTLIRCYQYARFQYAFYSEKLAHDWDEEGNAVALITGRGMEVVSLWSKIGAHDYPASPSKNPTWVYGSNENFVLNPGFDDAADDPILTNPNGEDGNNDDGNAIGWSKRGPSVNSITAINDSANARTGDWYIEVDADDNHSGMEQSITVTPNKVYHVRAYVKDATAAGMRVTLALGGADDISATATYSENFVFGDEILAELGNVARNPSSNGLPGGSTDGTWQVMDVEVLTGSEQTSLTIAVQNDHHLAGVFVNFWVEDITIEGWGLGLEPWEAFSPGNHATDSFRLAATPTFGASPRSVRIDPTGQFAGVTQTMAVNPNTKYTTKIWVQTAAPAVDDYYRLQVVANDGLDTILGSTNDIVPDDDVMTQYEVIFTTDSDTTEVKLRMFYSGVNNAAVAYFDSASMVPGEPATTAGAILDDILDAMAAVGKLTYLQRTFTNTQDSNGVPWPSNLSLDIDSSESLYGLLSRFVALGHEWEIVPTNFIEGGDTGFALNVYTARAFNPDSGVDVSYVNDPAGPVIVPGDATFAGRIVKTAFNINTVTAMGDEGVWSQTQQFPYETSDIPSGDPAPTGYKDSFGIIEDVITVPSTDSSTISQYGEARLDDEKGKERVIQLKMRRGSDLRPLLDFRVGTSMFVDMPPYNPDPPDSTTGLRSYPKRIRAIHADLTDGDEQFIIDIDRVVYEDEMAWLAMVAQLAERSPSENTGQGTGSVAAIDSISTVQTSTVQASLHTHKVTSTEIVDKATSGDVSGTLPGPITVNKIKGSPVSVTIPSSTQPLDPHQVVWILDRDLLQWVPTELIDPHDGFFNGTMLETMRVVVTESGGTVTMALDKAGGGDVTMHLSDGDIVLDTTPALTIDLTTGADDAPTPNFIYILQSDKILTKSTSDFPTDVEHIKVVFFSVPSATFVAAHGLRVFQVWNDHLEDLSGQGHMADMSERQRREPANWHKGLSGAGTTDYLTIAGTTVDLKIASGFVYQMHKHTVPAFDTSTGDVVLVKNWFGDAWHDITNLYDIVADSTGTTIGTNKYFNLVLWRVANETGTFDPTIINLSAGFYTSLADAENDVDGFDDLTIPREFLHDSSTGFLVARITIQVKTSTWEHKSTRDLRGSLATTAVGGAAGVMTDFSDNQFSVFNVDDVSKIVAFDVSQVSTGTKRTYVMPDVDGTIGIDGSLPVKTDTGDPGSPFEGQIYVNTFDNTVRVYADGAWRDLVTWL